jgi:hypothetical protein
MGQSCNLYLNTKWTPDEIKDVMERISGVKVQWKPTGQAGFDYLIGGDFQISCFWNNQTSVGNLTTLSRGASGAELLKQVAKVFGGLFEANDYDGNMEFIEGKANESNALPYFTRYAIVKDGINPNSIPEFIKSIDKWKKEISSNTNIIMP